MGLDDIKDKITDASQDLKRKSEDVVKNTEEAFDEAGTKLGEISKDIKDKSEDILDHDK